MIACANVANLLLAQAKPVLDLPAGRSRGVILIVYTSMYRIQLMKRTIKVGVKEFRERIAAFLVSDVPVAVTRHGETLGIYIPMGKRPSAADVGDLKAAAVAAYGVFPSRSATPIRSNSLS